MHHAPGVVSLQVLLGVLLYAAIASAHQL